jgi:hypothetical protein
VAESRDGLEQEITRLLGRYWHGGHFGVLSDDRETPKIWLYGLGLAKQEILNEISAVFRQRGVSVAQLILDLDQLAIDRGF